MTGYEGALFVSGFYSVSDLSQPGYEVDPHSDPPPGSARTISTGDSLGYLMLLVVVYYILAWWVNVCARACGCVVQALTRGSYMPWGRYLGQVFAGDLGASQPFYFPFTQAYWTGKRPAEKIVAGDTLAEVRATSAQRGSIELHKLSKAYASKTAVQEVSLSIYPGQLLALLGQNGAGTVPSCVCPLHTSCANAVLYGCQARLHWCTCWLACSIPRTVLPLCVVEALAKIFRCCETKLAPGESSMASCGRLATRLLTVQTVRSVSPQHDHLWPELTARQHLYIYSKLKRVPADKIKAHVEERMQRVRLMPGKAGDNPVQTYSGGMKRRLSVAIATVGDPKTILLDEPTT